MDGNSVTYIIYIGIYYIYIIYTRILTIIDFHIIDEINNSLSLAQCHTLLKY